MCGIEKDRCFIQTDNPMSSMWIELISIYTCTKHFQSQQDDLVRKLHVIILNTVIAVDWL